MPATSTGFDRNKLLQAAQASFENQNGARKNFDDVDNKFNESASKILESFAKLAAEKPEEMFGLKPTEREMFIVNQALRPAIDRMGLLAAADDSGTELDLAGGDVGGGNPLAGVAAGLAAITDVLKSPQGPAILEKIFGHIQAEKTFFKDTGKELIGGIRDAIGWGTTTTTTGTGP